MRRIHAHKEERGASLGPKRIGPKRNGSETEQVRMELGRNARDPNGTGPKISLTG
jgi:hypothetical protein